MIIGEEIVFFISKTYNIFLKNMVVWIRQILKNMTLKKKTKF
jgi:hypothetical protein